MMDPEEWGPQGGLVLCRWREIGLRVPSWTTENNDVCSNQVIGLTSSRTGHSPVWTG